MKECFANFHLFHSQHCQPPLLGLCWCGKFECLGQVRWKTVTLHDRLYCANWVLWRGASGVCCWLELSCSRVANVVLRPISLIKKLHEKAIANTLFFLTGICQVLTSLCVWPLSDFYCSAKRYMSNLSSLFFFFFFCFDISKWRKSVMSMLQFSVPWVSTFFIWLSFFFFCPWAILVWGNETSRYTWER